MSDLAKRLQPLDILRGIAIGYVIFIHGAIYNFAGFGSLNISELPLALVVIGMIGLWGGIFAIYSLLANVLMTLRRDHQTRLTFRTIGYVVLAGLIFMTVIGTLQTLIFGRWSLGGEVLELSVVAELMRGQDLIVHWDKLFTGSGIRTIGLNLVVVPLVIYAIFRKTGLRDRADTYQLLFGLGLIVMIMSFLRIFFYSGWVAAVAEQNYLLAGVGSFLLADPYPGIAYLAYGFFGSGLALVLYYKRLDILKKYIFSIALALMAVGAAGVALNEPSMFGASWFWYFKMILETGLFVMFFVIAIWLVLTDRKMIGVDSRGLSKIYAGIIALSRISLTAYMFETLTSEALRYVWFLVNPDWEMSVRACLLFGATNLLIWILIALAWQRKNFKYSVEYGWVWMFRKFGKRSSKLLAEPL